MAWIERQEDLVACGHADSPLTALQAIAAHDPHIVLLDLQLRGGTAFDVLSVLPETELRARVIILTHKDEAEFAARCIHAGAWGYVRKDDAVDVLSAAMSKVLEGGLHVSDAVRRHIVQLRKHDSCSDELSRNNTADLPVVRSDPFQEPRPVAAEFPS